MDLDGPLVLCSRDSQSSNASGALDGRLTQLAIFDQALNESQIVALYSQVRLHVVESRSILDFKSRCCGTTRAGQLSSSSLVMCLCFRRRFGGPGCLKGTCHGKHILHLSWCAAAQAM